MVGDSTTESNNQPHGMVNPGTESNNFTPEMAAMLQSLLAPQPAMNGMAGLLEQLHSNLLSQQNNSIASGLALSQFHANPPKEDKELYCELCEKSFCNIYFLRSHQHSKHGGVPPEGPLHKQNEHCSDVPLDLHATPSTSIASQPSVIVNSPADRKTEQPSSPRNKRIKLDTSAPQHSKQPVASVHPDAPAHISTICDECGVEYDSILSLYTHKATEHLQPQHSKQEGQEDRAANCEDVSEAVHNQLQQAAKAFSQGHPAFNASPAEFNQILSGMLQSHSSNPFPFMLAPAAMAAFGLPEGDKPPPVPQPAQPPKSGQKRQYSSALKNFCDLCNKEVCNKYFLRTHMLKMHGVVIDENKSVIANIDTREKEKAGELSFRCDMCGIELKSRVLLREHKQEAHGVSYPSTNNHRSKTGGAGNTQAAGNHGANRKDNTGGGELMPALLPHDASSFSLPLTIQALLAQELGAKNEAMAQEGSSKGESQRQPLTLEAANSSAAARATNEFRQCPDCSYRTRFDRNMEHHRARHERLNELKGSREDRPEAKDTPEKSEEDEAMNMTTQIALHIARQNQEDSVVPEFLECGKCFRSYKGVSGLASHLASVHLPFTRLKGLHAKLAHKLRHELNGKKRERASRAVSKISRSTNTFDTCTLEANSRTSGSQSPGTEAAREVQCFSASLLSPSSLLPQSFSISLPVFSRIQNPFQITVNLVPKSDPKLHI